MVYLPGALSRTRSRNASSLAQSQQALGVTPSASPPTSQGAIDQPAAPPQPGGGVPVPAEGGFTPGAQQQPSRLTEYVQNQQQQREMLAARGEDLRLAQLMSRALDPTMPKGFRQLGLRQISQMLGIDPRGDRAKEIINTISGLDPQSLEGVRRGIISSTNDAQPGELTQMTRGVLTGQVPPDQLLSMAQGALQPPAAGGQNALASDADTSGTETQFEPPMRLGAGGLPPTPPQVPEPLATTAQAPGQAPLPGAPLPPRRGGPAELPPEAAPTTDVPQVDESRVPARMREIPPELSTFLGLPLEERHRLIDVYRAGWNRVPSDGPGMRKAITEGTASQVGLVDTTTMASQLAALVAGRPEALDSSIKLPGWLGGDISVNPSSLASKVIEFVKGLGHVGGVTFENDGDVSRRVMEIRNDPRNAAFIERQTAKVIQWLEDTGQRVGDTAELNARINSVMVPLAFAMAAAKGQTGRFLSDKDVEFQLREIGQSNNPQQFIAALTDMTARLHQQYDTRMRGQFGASVPINHLITPEIARDIQLGGIAPPAVMSAAGGPAPPRPTVGEPGTSGYRDLSPVAPGATAAPSREVPQPQPRPSLPRQSPTIEAEEAAAVGRLQEDRAAALEQRGQNRRRLEIAESQEARAQRAEVEARRLRVQQAFERIGAALRGAVSSGGGGLSVPGAAQDTSAFRITPAPQRRAPTPVPAQPFQPQLPQQRQRR